jgi:uncharacterized protein YoxC
MSTVSEVLTNSINTLNAEIQSKAASIQQFQVLMHQLPPAILDLDHDAWQAVKVLVGATQ